MTETTETTKPFGVVQLSQSSQLSQWKHTGVPVTPLAEINYLIRPKPLEWSNENV